MDNTVQPTVSRTILRGVRPSSCNLEIHARNCARLFRLPADERRIRGIRQSFDCARANLRRRRTRRSRPKQCLQAVRRIAKRSAKAPLSYPRMLCFVSANRLGRLGADLTAPLVASRRSSAREEALEVACRAFRTRSKPSFYIRLCSRRKHRALSRLPAFRGGYTRDVQVEVLYAGAALDRGFDRLAGWMRKAESGMGREQELRTIYAC